MRRGLHRLLVIVVALAIIREGLAAVAWHYIDAAAVALFGVPWRGGDDA